MSQWKQGDTLPDMVIQCFDDSRSSPDLSDATLTVTVTHRGDVLWEKEVDGDADGVVTVPLTPDDTATVGTFFVKVKAVWPDGKQQHYPPADSFMKMTVTR